MDGKLFDTWVASLADAGSTRRSLLARLAGGSFAAVLTTLGIGAFSAEDVEAKKGKRRRGRKKGAKSCAQQCKRKGRKRGKKGGGKKRRQRKQACLAKCNQQPTPAKSSFPIPPGGPSVECVVGVGGTGCAAGLICTPVAPGGGVSSPGVCLGPCTTPGGQDTCASGQTCTTVNGINVCLPASVGVTQCETGEQCLATGFCDETSGLCALCPEICGEPTDAVCCAVGFECVDSTGECVISAGP
jgi:hypothetical protein